MIVLTKALMLLKKDDFLRDILHFVVECELFTVQFALGQNVGASNDFSQTSNIVQNDRLILIFGKTDGHQNL
jgi:hypothetical protein